MPTVGIELARAVVQHRVGLGQLVALALARDHVQELRPRQLLQVLQRRDQRIKVVAVDRADVVEAEFLEQRARHHHALGMFLELLGQLEHRRRSSSAPACRPAWPRHRSGRSSGAPGSDSAPPTAGEIDMSLSFRIDQQRGRRSVTPALFSASNAMPALIAPSPMTATACRSLALVARCHRHAERGRDRGRRMRGAEGVVFAFRAAREARDAAVLAQRRHAARAGRSESCARRSGGRRPRRCGRRACRTRSAARSSARPCRGWSSGGRRSSTRDSSTNCAQFVGQRRELARDRAGAGRQVRRWSASSEVMARRCVSSAVRAAQSGPPGRAAASRAGRVRRSRPAPGARSRRLNARAASSPSTET